MYVPHLRCSSPPSRLLRSFVLGSPWSPWVEAFGLLRLWVVFFVFVSLDPHLHFHRKCGCRLGGPSQKGTPTSATTRGTVQARPGFSVTTEV